jgi:broad specificity phosphatase PhoE
VRLLLISQAAASEDDADAERMLGPAALARAADLVRLLPRPRTVFSGPAPAAVQTAAALGLAVTVVEELHGWDPEAEAPDELIARMRAWLDGRAGARGTQAAVADAASIRAAVAAAVEAPSIFGRLDIASCSVTELSFRDGRWHLAHVNWEPALLHIPQRRGRRRARRPA